MSRILITADTHAYHKKIAEIRGYPNEIDMTKQLIKNINSLVKPADILYHLGDFAVGCSIEQTEQFREEINCLKIILVKGNHDWRFARKNSKYYSRFKKLFHKMKDVLEIKPVGRKIFLSHYSCRDWPGKNRGNIHLFGHSHGKLGSWGRSFDIGVDTNSLLPYSLDQVFSIINQLETTNAY